MGGDGYQGSSTCTHDGSVCKKESDAWSMCRPQGGTSEYGVYNLQLYGWSVESNFFTDNMWGNHWLGLYNVCYEQGHFPGGIGFLGSWGATLDRMIECGTGNESTGIEQQVVTNFCTALQCAFVPALASQALPYLYRNAECQIEVPTFEEVVLNLTSRICGSFDCPVVLSGAGGALDPLWCSLALALAV